MARCGSEDKFKSDKDHEPLMKRLERQKIMGKITEEEYDEMKGKYEGARKMEREMDAFDALKDVRAGNIVMPHGEIFGTTKVFPYKVDVLFAESMRGKHPQFRESKSSGEGGLVSRQTYDWVYHSWPVAHGQIGPIASQKRHMAGATVYRYARLFASERGTLFSRKPVVVFQG